MTSRKLAMATVRIGMVLGMLYIWLLTPPPWHRINNAALRIGTFVLGFVAMYAAYRLPVWLERRGQANPLRTTLVIYLLVALLVAAASPLAIWGCHSGMGPGGRKVAHCHTLWNAGHWH